MSKTTSNELDSPAKDLLLKQKLTTEYRRLEEEIDKFKLSDDNRKHERMKLLQKYNDTKDNAQVILGTLAELECVSTGVLYKNMGLSSLIES